MVEVGIQRYTTQGNTVKNIVKKVNAFKHLPANAKVIIKPNIVIWLNGPFPKWGVITTSKIMEETVILLKEFGVNNISIAEGSLQMIPGEKQKPR